MFSIEVNAFRALRGMYGEKYEVKVKIGNMPVPYEAELITDWYHEVEEFIRKHKEYLAGRGIAHVQMVENEYWASSTPDTHTYISDITEYSEVGKKWKDYWVSAYTMHGDLFMASLVATDDKDFSREFERAFPDCDFADYGCWQDLD